MGDTLERFTIHVDDRVLDDLRARLALTRFPDQIAETGWEYGIPVDYVRDLVGYWRNRYDWRTHEARLNELDHFRTEIDGQPIHFVHARSTAADAFPLLLTHGWPGSVVEFLDVIPLLTAPGDGIAFDVVAPSLPGYAFSGPTHTRGWDVSRIACAFAALMDRLGYERYGAQGGDWGAQVATRIGALDTGHCAAIHLNMPIANPPAEPVELGDADKADHAPDARRRAQRLPGRAARLDRREAPDVERLRRRSRERLHARPDAHERDGVLGHADDHVLGPPLLGAPAHPRRAARVRRGPDGRGALPEGDPPLPAPLGRTPLQRDALGRDATGRALRRDGATRAVRRRPAHLLPHRRVSRIAPTRHSCHSR